MAQPQLKGAMHHLSGAGPWRYVVQTPASKSSSNGEFPIWLGTKVLDPENKFFGKALPFFLKEIAGIKVGFIGLLTPKPKKNLPVVNHRYNFSS